MAKLELKVGQTVWVKVLEAGKPFSKYKEIKEDAVASIGSKYFTLESFNGIKFRLDCGANISLYTPHLFVYETKQQILDIDESKELKARLTNVYLLPLTLDQLRRITAIINEPKPE